MEKHLYIDCTLIKNHPDCNAYMDYLVDNHFIHNVENLPYGILPLAFPFANDDYIGYVFDDISVKQIAVPDEDNNCTNMAVLINMDCTRIELLINADGSSTDARNRIARNALVKYLEPLDFGKSEDSVVFHLGEVLRDAFQDNGEEHKLPSGANYKVVDKPFHGDIIGNVLNNISIHRHDMKIEQVVMEALGISREQANFVHAFCACSSFCRHSTHFDYRDRHLTLFLTADANGGQAIEVAPLDADTRVKINDIHDLKSVIDKKYFNNAPVETPKEELVETPKEAPQEEPEAEPEKAPTWEPDNSVRIKANAYIEAFNKKEAEIISRTDNDEGWLAEFNETATPEEIVGYYFHTYGIVNALKWWKKDSEKTERTGFEVSVDRIFDSIFCPFCKQKKRMSFSSTVVSLEYQKEGVVHCYNRDEYTGCMIFPICPQCGSKLE